MKVTRNETPLNGCVPVYNPQWDRYMQIDKAFHEYMAQHGFEVWHTGGGCTAWSRQEREDEHNDFYTLITYEGPKSEDMLGEWAAVADPSWIVGRYEGHTGGFLNVCGITLERALGIAERMPNPEDDEQEMLDPETLERIPWETAFQKKEEV